MENRTPDLVIANDALYQLSYDPNEGVPSLQPLSFHRKRKAIS